MNSTIQQEIENVLKNKGLKKKVKKFINLRNSEAKTSGGKASFIFTFLTVSATSSNLPRGFFSVVKLFKPYFFRQPTNIFSHLPKFLIMNQIFIYAITI